MPTSRFSAKVEVDADSGFEVLVLGYRGGKNRATDIEARVAPEAGGNLFSLKIGDDELLVQPDRLADLKLHRFGTPVLFPTPNRVRDAAFVFAGRTFTFEANRGTTFLHGLVRQRPWRSGKPRAARNRAEAKIWIDWDEAQPDFARFPIEHRLEVTFSLLRTGVRIDFAVRNRAKSLLPFGFGLHPWFRVPGERKDVWLRVPAGMRMEAVNMLPTGKLLPVAGTPFDLRRPAPLSRLDLDDVYFGLKPILRPGFEWRDRGVRMTLGGSREFTHFVVYTPPNESFFCMENQTSSTDAHNLHARGLEKESHLMVLGPGKIARGHVDWKVQRSRA